MKYRDAYGNLLQYGDIVENLDTHEIGIIQRSSISDSPIIFLTKRFNWLTLQYQFIEHNSALPCYERQLVPNKSKIYWRLHKYRLANIELLQHGTRNRRVKNI